jgi:hypothetical protein
MDGFCWMMAGLKMDHGWILLDDGWIKDGPWMDSAG